MPRQNVLEFVSRDVREARKARADHDICVQERARQQAELQSAIMQSRICLNEVSATLRHIGLFIDSHTI